MDRSHEARAVIRDALHAIEDYLITPYPAKGPFAIECARCKSWIAHHKHFRKLHYHERCLISRLRKLLEEKPWKS